MTEAEFIAALRPLATGDAARGLLDDTAVLTVGAGNLVLTHDMIVEGVHYLPADPPGDVAWKLIAVNLSDLAAKGARPLGVLLGYSLSGEPGWDDAFIAGLGEALAAFDVPLLGGDTVAGSADAPRSLGLTALGSARATPSRAGAQPGDLLWVSGTIGDAGTGLRLLQAVPPRKRGPSPEKDSGLRFSPEHSQLIDRYRRPEPRLALGEALAPLVNAMMDVSDGLLIEASRLAAASGLAVTIDLDRVPLSNDLIAVAGNSRETRIAAATAGDDYELLFAAPSEARFPSFEVSVTAIGAFHVGGGLQLCDGDRPIDPPARLGYEHRP